MRFLSPAGVLAICLVAVLPVRAADDPVIQRLATCQDSWFDWKDDPVRMKTMADAFQAAFVQNNSDPFFVPKKGLTVAGLKVLKAFPESVGMGVGFSVLVDATFDTSRKNVEKAIGKALKNCDTSDNMRTCGLDIAEKRTIVLMASDDKTSTSTLLGCYYYYAK